MTTTAMSVSGAVFRGMQVHGPSDYHSSQAHGTAATTAAASEFAVDAQPLTIGIMGPPLTGKSAFVSRLALELRREGFQVATVADLGEQAQRLGLPIRQNHTWTSAMWFITRGISNELEARAHADVVLVTGAVPEALASYLAALQHRGEQADSPMIDQLKSLVQNHSANYDLLFRTTLGSVIPTAATKPRDDDQKFRCLADHWIEQIGKQLTVENVPLPPTGHETALELAVVFVSERVL